MTDTFQPGALALVHKQADDASLWFEPLHITEDILQKALRELHAHVEQDAAQARFTGEATPQKQAEKEEKAMLQLIDERDAAEEALSQAYYIVTGSPPEWSNKLGHQEALIEIGEAVYLLKQAARTDLPGEGKP